MPAMRIRQAAREGRDTLRDAARLIKTAPATTVELGLILALAPALLQALLVVGAQGTLLGVWSGWIDTFMRGGHPAESLLNVLELTLRQTGRTGLGATLLELVRSLVFTPLLLASLALLYNGYVRTAEHSAMDTLRMAASHVKQLILVSLACMLANWFVQMVPSVVSGLLSLVAGLLSWIPLLGTVANVLAVVLSMLVALLTDFAVIVIFCYVWITAACEGVSGIGALVRSWQITRNNLRQTIASLLALLLIRWFVVLIFGVFWLFAGRPLGMPVHAVVWAYYVASALYTVYLGAATSALYQQRPLHGGPRPGQFRQGKPDLDHMKRANVG